MKKVITFIIVVAIIVIAIFVDFDDELSDVSSKAEFTDDRDDEEEEKYFSEALDFLDEILFLDMERKKDDELYNLRITNLANDATYLFNINGLTNSSIDTHFNMYVSDRDYFMNIDEETKEDTTSSGIKLTLGKDGSENFMVANFEYEDLYYTIQAHVPEDDSLTWEKFKKEIEKMEKENALHKEMKKLLTEKIDANFTMPTYFSSNLPLSSITIGYTSLQIKYWEQFEYQDTSTHKLSSKIEYTVNDEPIDIVDEKEFEDMTLQDDTEAIIAKGYDGMTESSSTNHQNVIIFQHKDTYYEILSANIESPIRREEPKELINIANSIIENN